MIRGLRVSPGRCPVCDQPHAICTSPGYRPPLRVVQLPSRARVARVATAAAPEVPPPPPTAALAPSVAPPPPPVVDDSPRARRVRRAAQRVA